MTNVTEIENTVELPVVEVPAVQQPATFSQPEEAATEVL